MALPSDLVLMTWMPVAMYGQEELPEMVIAIWAPSDSQNA